MNKKKTRLNSQWKIVVLFELVHGTRVYGKQIAMGVYCFCVGYNCICVFEFCALFSMYIHIYIFCLSSECFSKWKMKWNSFDK